jgi:hypothetical protein
VTSAPLAGYRVLWFADNDEVDEQTVLDLWAREAGVVGDAAQKRLSELACVAVAPDGSLAGVSTAYLARNDQLRADMWHYRTFVGAAHRNENLARHLLADTSEHLQRRFLSGTETRAQGMVMHIENEALRQRWNQGVWVSPAFPWDGEKWPWPFIGDSPRGDHVRVQWFPGAKAPLP